MHLVWATTCQQQGCRVCSTENPCPHHVLGHDLTWASWSIPSSGWIRDTVFIWLSGIKNSHSPTSENNFFNCVKLTQYKTLNSWVMSWTISLSPFKFHSSSENLNSYPRLINLKIYHKKLSLHTAFRHFFLKSDYRVILF